MDMLVDSFLIAMVMKSLPRSYNKLVTVVTQNSKVYTFSEFNKAAVRNFAESEKIRCVNFIPTASNSTSSDHVMKLKEFSSKKIVKYDGCKKEGHYARKCQTFTVQIVK